MNISEIAFQCTEKKNYYESGLYITLVSFKPSELPYPSFTFASQTDLFTQAGFQQKLAKNPHVAVTER